MRGRVKEFLDKDRASDFQELFFNNEKVLQHLMILGLPFMPILKMVSGVV